VEQYEALRAKEAEQVTELDTAREEAKAALAAFNDLSTRRYDLFMAAFDHVAAHIDPIFKVRMQGLGLVTSSALQHRLLSSASW
jgi:structural maintenance of chromosome 1